MKLNDISDNISDSVALDHFPTRWQAVLWRNYEFVPETVLASLLRCSVEEIRTAAHQMGLSREASVNPAWREAGYLTIIRNNWHLLNYEQLLELLDWSPEHLSYTLRKEDFLWGKLGAAKPDCTEVCYAPLTLAQLAKTEKFRNMWQAHIPPEMRGYLEPPFTFSNQYEPLALPPGESRFELQFIHSYAANCGDLLLDITRHDPMPENLLRQYASLGINGIWIHAILYQLHPVKGSEEFSLHYEERLKNLAILAERCAKYGIEIFLYLNEPRGMTDDFYQKNPTWRGVVANLGKKEWSNCTSHGDNQVLQWMEEALYHIFSKVPSLGGAFMITMSENPTHCNAQHKKHLCPYCQTRDGADLLADIAKAAERGIHRAAPEAKLLMSDWAWSEINIDPEAVFRKRVIDQLPENVWFMSISEWGKDTCIGGVPGRVYDYSISQPGPSKESAAALLHARKRNLKTVAKVQINNSWELSAVPYIPVPYLIEEHLDHLAELKVNGMMLSWTHGGYPSGNLMLLNRRIDDLLEYTFSNQKTRDILRRSLKCFSEAFKEFPFDIMVIYKSPVNYGPMNLLHLKETGLSASMIGYPFDDLTAWRSIYPEEIFEAQFQKLTDQWKSGLTILENADNALNLGEEKLFNEIKNFALASYCHFASTLQQIRFIRSRNAKDIAGMRQAVLAELETVKKLYLIARKDSRIGFESSNHYYYTLNDLLEKIVNCETIAMQLRKN